MHVFFASCPKGIESLLLDELKLFGAESLKATDAGVGFKSNMEVAYRACLWSRFASRIFLQLHRYSAADTDELYSGAQEIDWSEHMTASAQLATPFTILASA